LFLRAFTIFALVVLAPASVLAVDPSPPTAGIPPVACQTRFARLAATFKRDHQLLSKQKAEAELKLLEQKLAREIFPEVQEVKTGRRIVEKRVKTSDADKKRFKDHFDSIWTRRVAAGHVPPWELKEYRKWLATQPDSEGAYPAINAKELLSDYVNDGGTITEYFDFKYLEYLEKVKFTRPDGTTAHEAVEAYMKTLNHNMLRHYAKALATGTKRWAKGFVGGAAASTLIIISAFPGELVNAALDPWIQPIKDFFLKKTKEQSAQAAEAVKDWTGLFVGGEDEYVAALDKLRGMSITFELTNLDEKPRAEALKEFNRFVTSTSAELPRFHTLVMSERKDFESIWDKRLIDTKESIVTVSASFTQHRIALDQLKAIIKNRGDAPTPEELSQLAEYEHEMELAEDYIANLLADWIFYRQARGPQKPIDAAIDRNFATIYEKYMRTMRVGRLAKAVNTRVKAHVQQLESYSKKAAGKKVDLKKDPVAGEPAAKEKPEEQIRVETPIVPPEVPKRVSPN
jgi:hypothetical protein